MRTYTSLSYNPIFLPAKSNNVTGVHLYGPGSDVTVDDPSAGHLRIPFYGFYVIYICYCLIAFILMT